MMDLIDREQALNVLDAEAWSFTEYLQKDIGNVFDVHLACFADDVRERLKDMPTVQAVPIEKIKTLINDIEIMPTSPALIDNDDVQRFAENVLYALNLKMCEEEQDNANQHTPNALNALEGDAISRQKVLDVINLNWDYRRNCIRAIEKLPSVNPQEPKTDVLDKIRAEIEQTTSRYTISRERDAMGQVEWSDRLIKESEILEILDKYKAESDNCN